MRESNFGLEQPGKFAEQAAGILWPGANSVKKLVQITLLLLLASPAMAQRPIELSAFEFPTSGSIVIPVVSCRLLDVSCQPPVYCVLSLL